jgi:hypothetical protein
MNADENQQRQGIDRIYKNYRTTEKTEAFFCLNLVNPVNPVHSGFALIGVHRRLSAAESGS